MLTRRQPAAIAAASDSSSRMPPLISTSMSRVPTIRAWSSRLWPRPKAASRSTRWIHSAPACCQRSAASTGSPKRFSEPATPWTSWTAWPPAMSTAGSSWRGGRHRSPSTHERSRAAPASPDFSGWNWVAGSGPFSTAATNRSPPCSAQVTSGRPGQVVGHQGPVADGVGVHEVEALVLDAGEQGGPGGGLDGVPAHVRDHRRLEPLDGAGPLAAPLGGDAVLHPGLEEDLHAHADAEHRTAAREPAADHLVTAHRAQARACRRRRRRRPGRPDRRPRRRRRGRR